MNECTAYLEHSRCIGEHGEWDKHTNFDLNTHAPVMFRVPGLTDGGVQTKMTLSKWLAPQCVRSTSTRWRDWPGAQVQPHPTACVDSTRSCVTPWCKLDEGGVSSASTGTRRLVTDAAEFPRLLVRTARAAMALHEAQPPHAPLQPHSQALVSTLHQVEQACGTAAHAAHAAQPARVHLPSQVDCFPSHQPAHAPLTALNAKHEITVHLTYVHISQLPDNQGQAMIGNHRASWLPNSRPSQRRRHWDLARVARRCCSEAQQVAVCHTVAYTAVCGPSRSVWPTPLCAALPAVCSQPSCV